MKTVAKNKVVKNYIEKETGKVFTRDELVNEIILLLEDGCNGDDRDVLAEKCGVSCADRPYTEKEVEAMAIHMIDNPDGTEGVEEVFEVVTEIVTEVTEVASKDSPVEIDEYQGNIEGIVLDIR